MLELWFVDELLKAFESCFLVVVLVDVTVAAVDVVSCIC